MIPAVPMITKSRIIIKNFFMFYLNMLELFCCNCVIDYVIFVTEFVEMWNPSLIYDNIFYKLYNTIAKGGIQ